jgi:hypothetical protein
VYATGKFALKLLRYLKGERKLGDDEYETLESWMEAARTNTLSAEYRAGMVRMVKV